MPVLLVISAISGSILSVSDCLAQRPFLNVLLQHGAVQHVKAAEKVEDEVAEGVVERSPNNTVPHPLTPYGRINTFIM